MITEMVSVIVAAYNEEKNIEKCVLSLLNQTYPYMEIIVIDDGSTDNTWDILKKLRDNFAIKICRIQNSGVGAARNKGMDLAMGTWIAFSDADDFYENNAFELLMEVGFQKKCSIVQGGLKRNGQKIVSNMVYTVPSMIIEKILLNYETKLDDEYSFFNEHLRRSIHGPYGKIFKKDIIKHITFKKEMKLGEDLLFYLEALTFVEKISVLENDIYNVCANPNSVTRRFNPDIPEQAILFCENTYGFLKQKNLLQNLGEDFSYQVYLHFYVAVNSYFLNKENNYNILKQSNLLYEYIENTNILKYMKNLTIDKKISWPEALARKMILNKRTLLYTLLYKLRKIVAERRLIK